jgi:hypothetical protein
MTCKLCDIYMEALPGMEAGAHRGYLVLSTNDPNALALPVTVTLVIGSDLLI